MEGSGLRPVQLVREEDAHPTAKATEVPVYEPEACAGCPQIPLCMERGDATVFHVHEIRGDPLYCQKIDGDLVPCEAEHLPDLEPDAGTPSIEEPDRRYLVDASVLINAERWQWENCQLVLDRGGRDYELWTTDLVWEELEYAYQSAVALDVVDVDPDGIEDRLVEIAEATEGLVEEDDAASIPDLSLVQALIDHDKFDGLLTEDNDLHRMHVPSIVEELTGRAVRCLRSREFVDRHPGWFESV